MKCSKYLRTAVLKNIYSFKLELVDLTIFPDLNLRLAKIKPYTTTRTSKVSEVTLRLSHKLSSSKIKDFFSYIFN